MKKYEEIKFEVVFFTEDVVTASPLEDGDTPVVAGDSGVIKW